MGARDEAQARGFLVQAIRRSLGVTAWLCQARLVRWRLSTVGVRRLPARARRHAERAAYGLHEEAARLGLIPRAHAAPSLCCSRGGEEVDQVVDGRGGLGVGAPDAPPARRELACRGCRRADAHGMGAPNLPRSWPSGRPKVWQKPMLKSAASMRRSPVGCAETHWVEVRPSR